MADVPELVDHLFRRQAGPMTAGLLRRFGAHHFELVEEVVQDSFLKALRLWPFHGVPPNPPAWLHRTAVNGALDHLRRDARLTDAAQAPEPYVDAHGEDPDAVADDMTRLIFLCCDPRLAPESRVPLTLKSIGGFGVSEIARALLQSESTIAQRLVRAKGRLRRDQIPFQMPDGDQLPTRLSSVHQVLYLIFNEGHSATHGTQLIREELCGEAIRLITLLLRNRRTATHRGHALAALFHFLAARLPARRDHRGMPRLLQHQDRGQWDRAHIAAGIHHLRRSAGGRELSRYHLEAEIAACHTLAPSYEATDWQRILDLYDHLQSRTPSPIVALNRAVALAEQRDAAAGLATLDAVAAELDDYYPYHAVRAELLQRQERGEEAAEAFARAAALCRGEPLSRYFRERVDALL